MKTILVPMDFSEEAQNALDLALEIAKKDNTEILLPHIIETPGYFYDPQGEFKESDSEKLYTMQLINHFQEQMDRLKQDNADHAVEIKTHIEIGSAYQSLARIIEENKVELIVMGSKGVSGIKEVLLGSTTQRMVRHINCPILTIKKEVNIDNFKKIVFATNCTQTSHYVTNEIQMLAKTLGAKLHLLMVNTKDNWKANRELEAQLHDFAAEHNMKDYEVEVYNDNTALEGIIHYSEDKKADMIALMTHGVTTLSHLVSGSIAEKVASYSTLPVWTCGYKNVKYR